MPGGGNSSQRAKGNVGCRKTEKNLWTEADGRYSVTMLAKADGAVFAGTGFGKFLRRSLCWKES